MIGPFGLRPKATMSVRALPLARALAARGHTVELILPPWNWPDHSGQTWQEDRVSITNVPLPAAVPLWRHLILTWRVVRSALSKHPDVVHCFKPKAYAGLAATAIWTFKRLGLCKVWLVVDADDWEGRGGWNDLQGYSWAEKRFFAFQEAWGLTHCDAVTVASRALETLAWSRGAPPDSVFYLPNGIPSQPHVAGDGSCVRQRHGLGDRPIILLYTRFFEFRVQRAIEILGRVVDAVPEVALLVVGQGLFGEERQLLARAEEAGLSRWLVYAGWIEPEVLPDYLAAADVAIYPFDDTLVNRTKCSVKLIELLAAGLPVVADAVGQNTEYIKHEVSGLLLDPGDTEAFAAAVVRLLRDPELRQRLGQAARIRLQQRFAWEHLAAQAEAAYLGGPKPAPSRCREAPR